MKKNLIGLVVVLAILVLVIVTWQVLLKKSGEGEACKVDKNCQEGLKCVINICSSGKVGSPCLNKTDCLSGFCVENKCTEGKAGSFCLSKDDCQTQFCVGQKCTKGKESDPCVTYNDCDELLCVNSVCSKFSEKPDEKMFKEYFSFLRLGKATEMFEEGPPQLEIVNVFKLGDNFCLDGRVLKDVNFQLELYDPYEEVVIEPKASYPGGTQKTDYSFTGCGSLLQSVLAGKKYEYKVYVGDTLVAVLPFEVTEK